MSTIFDSIGIDPGIIIIALLAIVVILIGVMISNGMRLTRLERKYKMFMKGSDAQSLEKTFVRKYTKNLVAYAKIKISMNINAMRKIGNLAYYKVCEVTLTRTNSVVIKFELKDNIRQAIETMQKEVEKRDSPDV